jgi:hypothetical protein
VPPGFEVVLDEATLGKAEASFGMFRIEEGLLVVRNMPAAAFLVTEEGAKALPDLFAGLRSPVPAWGPLDFSVNGAEGSLRDLRLDIDAPSSGEVREVRGKPNHWKVTKPVQPVWIAPEVVATPVETKKGARIFERAVDYQAPASKGFRFEFLGPSRGETLPVPAPGKNGCKYRLLGHPFLAALPDGSLLGVGTECTSGEDYISTGKLQGVAWPYQVLLPRIGSGHLAVERWKDGKSTVTLLPGAEKVAAYAGVEISVQAADDVDVVSQLEAEGSEGRLYVAHFDGKGFTDITPPDPPEWATPYRSRKGTLFLFTGGGSFRRTQGGWERIRMAPRGGDDGLCREAGIYYFAELPGGDIYMSGIGRCFWHLPEGAVEALGDRLPQGDDVRRIEALGGTLYMLVEREGGQGVLLRRRP